MNPDGGHRNARRSRFILVVDHDGISISWSHGKRLALWFGRAARRRFGLVEVFTPRSDWLS